MMTVLAVAGAIVLLAGLTLAALYAYVLWGVAMDTIGTAINRAAAWFARRFGA